MATKIKIGDVEDAARLILLDTYEGAYRFEPKEIYAAIADAVETIRVARPVSRYVNGASPVDVEFEIEIPAMPDGDPQSPSYFGLQTIEMERKWQQAVVYYVVHKMYLKDDPDTTNQALSEKYLQLYNTALGG